MNLPSCGRSVTLSDVENPKGNDPIPNDKWKPWLSPKKKLEKA